MALSLKSLRDSGKRTIERKLFMIPFLFTFLNAFFGLLAVVNTLDENYILAAYCILLAACMDFCDGRLARAFGSCSGLGMELDSLCDAVSFCFAPAILLYAWRLHEYGILGLLVVTGYLCAGLFRLAKFNSMQMNQMPYFLGLPTTFAAFFIANLVLAYGWVAQSPLYMIVSYKGLIAVIVSLAFLMPCTLRFSSFKRYNLNRAMGKSVMAITGLACLVCLLAGYPVLFLIALAYIVGNVAMNLFIQ